MDNLFSAYGVVALTHLGLQMGFAHLDHRKQKRKEKYPMAGIFPSVGVVIPVYNEDCDTLKMCIESVLGNGYPGEMYVSVVDDGSTNQCPELTEIMADPRFNGIVTSNLGKREAQMIAFKQLKGKAQIIVTIDSDTIIEAGGIQKLIEPFVDIQVGAVTGHVQVTNERKNLLTRIISSRYWNAFNQERAAQSLFGVVFCCSGPFSAYRSEIIARIAGDYTNQTFLGAPCTFGDDRHLTNLIMREGYKVQFAQNANAFTHVPENLNQYRKQQIRWSKSFAREMFWTFPNLRKHHIYFAYDFLMQLILPFFLIAALIHAVTQGISNPVTLAFYAGVIFLLAFIRAIYALLRTRKLIFLIFGIYGFMYIFFLIPIKIYALATVRNNGWGTR